jgi:hypothetical protein
MARGPKGEYRPTDPLKGGMLVMRIAVGELTEEDGRKLAKAHKVKRKAKKRAKVTAKRRRN